VTALRWEWIAIGYYTYLLTVALAIRRFSKARMRAFAATSVCVVVLGAMAIPGIGPRPDNLAFDIVIPLSVLLGGYRLSGLFFVSPMGHAEAWLMAVDERLLRRTGVLAAYQAGPRVVREFFEMAYVLVYPVIPAGAVTLAIGGHAAAIPRFWAVVLLAEFISYGALPWLQTRPPRALEDITAPLQLEPALRRLNASILNRGSIQANTVPSGHAAGAVAAALAVADAMPVAGVVFLLLASAIVAATVLGRYHYFVDSLLGIIVAVGAWFLVSH
jgi:membrane-associated phospholipid phosphatase